MGKVDLLVKYCLITEKNEYNIKGIFTKDKKIKFIDKDSKMLLDKKKLILIRETNDLKITFNFEKSIVFIYEKTNHINFNFAINILELENKDDYFLVKYQISDNKYQISIQIKD